MKPVYIVDGARTPFLKSRNRPGPFSAADLATQAGRVPVVVRDVAAGQERSLLEMALIENIQRENLNPLEEAQGLSRLIEEFGLTHDAAAKAVGRSRSAVSGRRRTIS